MAQRGFQACLEARGARRRLPALLLVLLAGCRSELSGPPKPIDQQEAGDYLVVALSPTGRFAGGKSELVLEFRRGPERRLVDPGPIALSLSMPMAGMPPMSGQASAAPFGPPGRYRVKTEVSMAGTWYLTVAFGDGQRATLKLAG